MTPLSRTLLFATAIAVTAPVRVCAQDEAPQDNQCLACHGTAELWEDDRPRLYVTADHMAGDVHWQKGISCQDCHGGNAATIEWREAHAAVDGFRKIASPADMPAFCGHCHSDEDYMRGRRSLLPTDQEAEYWTSGHGRQLKLAGDEYKKTLEGLPPGDTPPEMELPPVATCVSCHSVGKKHHIVAVDDPNSPVYPTRVAHMCAECHSNAELMAGRTFQERPLGHDQFERWQNSAHGQAMAGGDLTAATCNDCHGNHGSVSASQLTLMCGNCHKDQLIDVRKSVHAKAGPKNPSTGAGTLMECTKCHGDDVHGMLPADDSESPVFLEHQVALCGNCHEKFLESYDRSVHGHGLHKSGLRVTAVCANCHGSHAIHYAADRRSTLHASKVAATCGECHRFIEERLQQSVHAQIDDVVSHGKELAAKKSSHRKPNCIDCHQGHDQPHPESPFFRMQLPYRCSNCHPKVSERYRLSLHGELTHLGYEPAAKCSDCHGAHDILPVSDPNSRLAGENRLQTCRECHPSAVRAFAAFDPHASHKDKKKHPGLYSTVFWLKVVLFLIFFSFMIHALAWFVRSFLQTLIHGRHRRLAASERAIGRPDISPRVCYILLLISFPGLTLTGLPLKYSDQPWATKVADALGGFESTSVWHHFFAVIVIGACLVHVWQGVSKIIVLRRKGQSWKEIVSGPDSSVLRRRDLKDLLAMFRWFVGRGRKPGFERWSYWEKCDYWFSYYAVAIVAISGLVLWQPNLFCRVLPGGAINLAKTVHAEIALMAASFLFGIHLFNTHMRPEKFPVDLSAFNGMVSEEHLRSARPEYVERLEREGRLEELCRAAPSKWRLWLVGFLGLALLLVGLAILLAVIMAQLGK